MLLHLYLIRGVQRAHRAEHRAGVHCKINIKAQNEREGKAFTLKPDVSAMVMDHHSWEATVATEVRWAGSECQILLDCVGR